MAWYNCTEWILGGVDVGRLLVFDLACPRSIKSLLPRFYLLVTCRDVVYQALSSLSACNIERSGVGLGTRLAKPYTGVCLYGVQHMVYTADYTMLVVHCKEQIGSGSQEFSLPEQSLSVYTVTSSSCVLPVHPDNFLAERCVKVYRVPYIACVT